MNLSTALEHKNLKAVRLETSSDNFAYLIPLPSLPLKAEKRAELFASVSGLVQLSRDRLNANRSVWLDLEHLHQDNAIRQISKYGPLWGPEMGLGLRPESDPPRYWTEDDLMNRDHDSPMPALMRSVMLLNADEKNAMQACEAMTGTGGLIQVVHRCTTQHLQQAWYDVLQPSIREEGLAAFPIYMPLFALSSFTERALPLMELCMRDVDLYVRESVADSGILLLSRQEISPLLEEAGLVK